MATRRPPAYHQSTFWRLYDRGAELLDHKVGWDRLPVPLGLVTLVGLRDVLRKRNLYDTNDVPAVNLPPVAPATPEVRTTRTVDGTHNDLDEPRMGMAGFRFGRNVPIDRTYTDPPSEFMRPSPREVSRALLTRDQLIPATSANALVATWLQFMIKDWFSHGSSPTDHPWEIPLTDDDPWPDRPMRIMRTRPDPTAPAGEQRRPTHASTSTHWWDLSQIYGTSAQAEQFVRAGTDGKLRVDPDGLPPLPDDPAADPRLMPGFWTGLLMMQTLFTLEHNAICDRLRAEYPQWSDDEIFQRARLINAALVAKIHTVEWTPAVIAHPATKIAMRANWFGLAGERVHKLFGRLSGSEVVSGIPGSQTEYYGVPFSLTEEFVAVYRMHPLVPDDYSLRSSATDQEMMQATLRDLAGANALEVARKMGVADLLYSFGTQHPGLVTLHNFPRYLQEFQRPDGHLQDLAATDILRSRELGVPRYNEFRRLLHLAPAKDFDDLTDNPAWAREIEQVYHGDIEQVDLMVGAFAERRPSRVRVQRHRVPDLHPDGVATAQQRQVLHCRLHPGDLYPGRDGLDQRQQHDHRPAAPLPAAAARDRRPAERVPALGPRGARIWPAGRRRASPGGRPDRHQRSGHLHRRHHGPPRCAVPGGQRGNASPTAAAGAPCCWAPATCWPGWLPRCPMPCSGGGRW